MSGAKSVRRTQAELCEARSDFRSALELLTLIRTVSSATVNNKTLAKAEGAAELEARGAAELYLDAFERAEKAESEAPL